MHSSCEAARRSRVCKSNEIYMLIESSHVEYFCKCRGSSETWYFVVGRSASSKGMRCGSQEVIFFAQSKAATEAGSRLKRNYLNL